MRTVEEIQKEIDMLEMSTVLGKYERINQLDNEMLQTITSGIPLARLREICDAEREQRCVLLPSGEINNYTTLWFVTKDGYVYKAQAHELGNVIWYYKPKQFYITREAAEAAKGEKQ